MPRLISPFLAVLFFLFQSGCALLLRTPAIPSPAKPPAPDRLRGVFHVHTEYSGDSDLSLDRLIKAGRKAELDYIVVTDHNTKEGEKVYESGGFPVRPILIFGEEITTEDGHVIALNAPDAPDEMRDSRQVVSWILNQGGFAVLAHPVSPVNPWRNWNLDDYQGLEIYNFGHTFYARNKFGIALMLGTLPPESFLRLFHQTPEEGLDLWKRESSSSQKIAFGASDAHIHWRWFGLAPENLLLYLQSVTLYVYVSSFNRQAVTEALIRGQSYLAFESLGDASRFRFEMETRGVSYKTGSTVQPAMDLALRIGVPRTAEIRVFHDDAIILERERTDVVHPVRNPGSYRVEVYREGRLWIVANPITVE